MLSSWIIDFQDKWEEHFQVLLNPREDEEYPNGDFRKEENDHEVTPPDLEDIKYKRLQNYKAFRFRCPTNRISEDWKVNAA